MAEEGLCMVRFCEWVVNAGKGLSCQRHEVVKRCCKFDGGQDWTEVWGEVVKLEMEGMKLEAVWREFMKLELPEMW